MCIYAGVTIDPRLGKGGSGKPSELIRRCLENVDLPDRKPAPKKGEGRTGLAARLRKEKGKETFRKVCIGVAIDLLKEAHTKKTCLTGDNFPRGEEKKKKPELASKRGGKCSYRLPVSGLVLAEKKGRFCLFLQV